MKKVAIFGVFDHLHEGHREFIKQARVYGQVYAIVARDSTVFSLKNKNPKQNEEERVKNVANIIDIYTSVLGDEAIGNYEVLKDINPDIVFLGYDQESLAQDLILKIKNKILPDIELIRGEAYKGDIYHTSLLSK